MTISILSRSAHGDSGAMSECIERYGGLVWSMARRLSRTPSDAEDATQEIFLDIWRCAARFDETRGSEKTFVAMIARRRLIDRLRKSLSEPLMDSSQEVMDTVACPSLGYAGEQPLDINQAMAAVANLRAEHREVLELGFLQGLTHSEIAARLDLPLGSVKSFMRRGLMKIRKAMTAEMTTTVPSQLALAASASA